MDDIDRQPIALLRKEARLPNATWAARLGVSRGTVANRSRKLEEHQGIVGCRLRLRPDAQPDAMPAWTGVRAEGNQTRGVVASRLGEPGEGRRHDNRGRWDLPAGLRAESTGGLFQVPERARLIKGMTRTETSIRLATLR